MKIYILHEQRWYFDGHNAPDDDDSWERDELRGVFSSKEKAHEAMETCLRKIKKSRMRKGYLTRTQGVYGGFADPVITEETTDNTAIYEICHEFSWGEWSRYEGDTYKVRRGNRLMIEEIRLDEMIKRRV